MAGDWETITPAKGGDEWEPIEPPAKPGAVRTYLNNVWDGWKMAGPLGAAMGASKQADELIRGMAYDAGGRVTDALAGRVSPEVAAGAGYATNVGLQAIPAIVGNQVAAKVGAPFVRSAAEATMRSALKPGVKDVLRGDAAKAIDTLLKEGVNVTPGGAAKLRSEIGRLNSQISDAIAQSSGATVDKARVAHELQGVLSKFERQVNPNADLAAIQSAWNEFLQHPLLLKENNIPVQLAQEMKQGTYRILKGKYGEVGSASTEAQKALARGLKEGINEAVPGIEALNARESALLNALKEVEKRAAVAGNKNPGGLAWLADNPGAWASFMADRSELFKSLVARMLNANQRTIPAAAGTVVGGAVGGYSGQE